LFLRAVLKLGAFGLQMKLIPVGMDNLALLGEETRKHLYDAAHGADAKQQDGATKKERRMKVGDIEFEALMRMLDNSVSESVYFLSFCLNNSCAGLPYGLLVPPASDQE
jgi:hypothetical protein